jgi:hypothetical protein
MMAAAYMCKSVGAVPPCQPALFFAQDPSRNVNNGALVDDSLSRPDHCTRRYKVAY